MPESDETHPLDPPTSDPTAHPPAYPDSSAGAPLPPSYPPHPAYGAPAMAGGPVGKVRGTGACIGLYIVTLGLYGIYWFYATHKEMKEHSNQGLGGGLALLLAIVVAVVMPYVTSSEVGGLYSRDGKHQPVTGWTGLWNFPGVFILIGPIVWFVKTNGALNDYWGSRIR